MALDFDSEKYKQASSQQKAWGQGLIAELELAGNERILDLGCGNGTLTAERTRQDDGTSFETFRRINVLARK